MRIKPHIEENSVVLIGDFNPAIFTPQWFLSNELISPADFDNAQTELIHNEIALFRTDWFVMNVQRERFVMASIGAIAVRIFDLTMRTFKEFLKHTPIRMAGINYSVNYAVSGYPDLTRIGEALAPKQAWGEWGRKLLGDEGAKPHVLSERLGSRRGGLISLTMEQSLRDDGNPGFIRARVEPSTRVKPGVFIEINDHYQVKVLEKVVGCSEIVGMIEGQFDSSIKQARSIIDQVMAL